MLHKFNINSTIRAFNDYIMFSKKIVRIANINTPDDCFKKISQQYCI